MTVAFIADYAFLASLHPILFAAVFVGMSLIALGLMQKYEEKTVEFSMQQSHSI
jgi:hypothetical protein